MVDSGRMIGRRRLITGGAAVLAGTVVLVACGSDDDPSSPAVPGAKRNVTIKILTADGSMVKFMNDIAPSFAALHPDLQIYFDIPAEQPAEVRMRLLDSLVAGSKIADSSDLDSEDTWIMALASGLDTAGFYNMTQQAAPYVSDSIGSLQEGTYKGRIVGIPGRLSATCYYYRDDIFDNDFETWDDFISLGEKVKKSTGSHIMIIEDSTSRHFNYMMPHAGGNVFDKEGKVNLDHPNNLEALETLLRLKTSGVAWTTSEFYGAGTWQAYRDETLIGAYMPSWYGDLLLPPNLEEQKGKWNMSAPPKFSAGHTGARGGAPVYPVVDGPNADVVFDFLAYALLSTENNVKRFVDYAVPPMNFDAYKDPRVKEAVHPFFQRKVAGVFQEITKDFVGVNPHPLLIDAYNLLNLAVPAVLAGEKQPKAALKETADELRALAGE